MRIYTNVAYVGTCKDVCTDIYTNVVYIGCIYIQIGKIHTSLYNGIHIYANVVYTGMHI